MHRILICGMDWRSEHSWNQSLTCSLLLVKVHITSSKHKHPGSVRWRLKGDFFLFLPCSGHHFHAGITEIKGGWGGGGGEGVCQQQDCKCLCYFKGGRCLQFHHVSVTHANSYFLVMEFEVSIVSCRPSISWINGQGC